MIAIVDLEHALAASIADARDTLDVGTDGEVVDQVVILVSFLLPNGQTIAVCSPGTRRDEHLRRVALEVAADLA